MPRPTRYSLGSFIEEHATIYKTADCSPSHRSPERHQWTTEELSRIRIELRKLAALRVMNATDAEDIVQDTLLTLIHSCPKDGFEKGPLAWSAGILRNKIGNYYRKSRHRANYETSESESQHDPPENTAAISPESALLREELINVIYNTVERLPKAQKTAVKMLIAGLSPGEIATKMSPERYQSVINHLHRGRKAIARELAKYGVSGMHKMRRAGDTKKHPTNRQCGIICG